MTSTLPPGSGPVSRPAPVELVGFCAIPSRLVADPDLSHAEIRVILALVAHAGPDHTCWPGVPRLGKIVGVCERQTRRILKDLVRKGYVSRAPRRRLDGATTSNTYRLNFERWGPPPDIDDPGEEGGDLGGDDEHQADYLGDRDKTVRAPGQKHQGDPDKNAGETLPSEPGQKEHPLNPPQIAGDRPVAFDPSDKMTRAERRRVENLQSAALGGFKCRQCGEDFEALHSYFLAGKVSRFGGQVVTGVMEITKEGFSAGYAHNNCAGEPDTTYEMAHRPSKAEPWKMEAKAKR